MEAAPTPADSPTMIKPINKSVVHRICAGQVILDLAAAVKELVENSLDAGATSIEISLKEHGEEWFQVIDNGSGISPNNFKVLVLKHHTSKLCDFPDLQSLTTFGFRGEALSSLCALGNLTVETRTKNESIATHLTYDQSGLLVAEKKTARQVGTTVTVKKLFSNLPVRSKEFKRNVRKEYGKLISLLNAYALIAKGVRFVCTNTTGKNVKSVVLKTQGSGSLKDNIITVFGMTVFSCLEPVNICISESCKVDGFLSKAGQGSGRNMGDRQFFFVNGRPVDMPKVSKLVNEFYKGANSRQYPIAIMSFTIPEKACDVNVTPDKRKIFLSDEASILHALREGLQQIYSPSNACYSVNKVEAHSKEANSSELCSPHDKFPMVVEQLSPDGSFAEVIEDVAKGATPLINVEDSQGPTHKLKGSNKNTNGKSMEKDFILRGHGTKRADNSRQLADLLRNFTADQITSSPSRAAVKGIAEPVDQERAVPSSSIVSIASSSKDLNNISVIGQFNLGFIIGKLDQDLFIVDQHAADEKYNFERLAQSTILNQQPLLRPLRLELSPEEEVVASMHMNVISNPEIVNLQSNKKRNGFFLDEDPHAPPGLHFILKAVPFSKNITFGVEDVQDLISTLADSQGECSIIGSYKMDTSDSVCPTRVRAMLASRACRSSVMIGDALGRNEMQKILEHLAELKSPWNCPHGRPTMRHLVDLTTISISSKEIDANL
ncbi:DNA mismatch repair protein PMS1 [Morella rubra]|uniref:DNA mismatch repair protein PMS1 n=1 Tax=Morella rubra TaxID=262757 RepID=A0A6A1URC4_9ROSI|nr:DNA mismatch repair protein PMS1 [Morella rubra]